MEQPQKSTALATNAPAPGSSVSQGFGTTELQQRAETAALAVAAGAKAEVESRYIMAMRQPRDIDDVRIRLLAAAKRPGFAQAAKYKKPIGGGFVEGPSIRFAEEALRCFRNVLPQTTLVYDDADKAIYRVSVTDLEANLTFVQDVTVNKTVERSNASGKEVLSSRKNSQGRTTYIVRATDDDMANKSAALISKALRGLALRIIPGDLVEEAMAQCVETSKSGGGDPEADRKKLIDAFAAQRVLPSDLKAYLGHDVGQASPAELQELREVFATLRDGEGTWPEILAAKTGGSEAPAAAAKETEGPAPANRTEAVLAKAKEQKAKRSGGAPAGEGEDPHGPSDEELEKLK
jgi:hypothetical protein